MTAQALIAPPPLIATSPLIGPADLIADCGHPQWPWWRLVMAVAIAVQFVVALAAHGDQLRPARSRPVPVRVVRVVRTGRGGGS